MGFLPLTKSSSWLPAYRPAQFHFRKDSVAVNTFSATNDKSLSNARKIFTAEFKMTHSYLHVFGSGGSGRGAASGLGSNCWTTVSAAGAE